jgi:hypothetical protein
MFFNILLLFYFLSLPPPSPSLRSLLLTGGFTRNNSTPNQLPAKTLSDHSSSPVGSLEFHTQLTSGQNNNKHRLSPEFIKPKFTNPTRDSHTHTHCRKFTTQPTHTQPKFHTHYKEHTKSAN